MCVCFVFAFADDELYLCTFVIDVLYMYIYL